jgi:hypothetical protein
MAAGSKEKFVSMDSVRPCSTVAMETAGRITTIKNTNTNQEARINPGC